MHVDVFKFDPNYLENEEKYKSIRAEILGEGSEDEESGSEESSSEDEDEGLFRSASYLELRAHIMQWLQTKKASKTARRPIS